MKKWASLGVAAFAALIAVLAVSGSLTPAQAYPELSFKLDTNRSVLYGGQTFTEGTSGSTVNSSGTGSAFDLIRFSKI